MTFVDPDQFDIVSLMDEKGLLVRDNLINYLQSAAENEQLPSLVEFDIPFKIFAEQLD